MYVVIVGAGEVGSSIAASLADTHDVAVVDIDSHRIEELIYEIDVLGVEGDGAELDTLEQANIEQADILIASTDDDETNIVTCGTANTVTDAFTISRVKSAKFLRTWQGAERAFGVDHMVATNLLTAESISRVVGMPAAQDVDTFADGTVQMAEFEIPEGSPIAGQTVREADRYESLTFAALIRADDVVIPTGETELRPGDDVVVIGSPESVWVDTAEPATPEAVADAMTAYPTLDLPSAPDQLVHVFDEPDRPQPRLDRNREQGMGVDVGGLQSTDGGVQFNCLAHNTMRGAAGASVLNGELLLERGYL